MTTTPLHVLNLTYVPDGEELTRLSIERERDLRLGTEATTLIRRWARAVGIPVDTAGALRPSVYYQWLDAHADAPDNIAISGHTYYDRPVDRWHRAVRVLCFQCGAIHTHTGAVGVRGREVRTAHCTRTANSRGFYTYDDALPVTTAERDQVAANLAADVLASDDAAA